MDADIIGPWLVRVCVQFGANKTLLVLNVLGSSYRLDDATIDATRKRIHGKLEPVDAKERELKESIKSGKEL
jgi:hypothetical protein